MFFSGRSLDLFLRTPDLLRRGTGGGDLGLRRWGGGSGWGFGWERNGVGDSHKLYVFFHRSPPVINLMVSVDVKQH